VLQYLEKCKKKDYLSLQLHHRVAQ
jgi:hypothetical protein